jgi:hypothetical protein
VALAAPDAVRRERGPRHRHYDGAVERSDHGNPVGLCASCRHARRVLTPRSTFWLCQLAAVDPRFDKYPRLPVLECDGHEPSDDEPGWEG